MNNPGLHNSLIKKVVPADFESHILNIRAIPQTFDDLFIVIKNLRTAHATADQDLRLYFNTDTTAGNYTYAESDQYGTTEVVNYADNTRVTSMRAQDRIVGSYATIWIPQYAQTRKKQARVFSAEPNNAGLVGHASIHNIQLYLTWQGTAGITQMRFQASGGQPFDTTSQFYIYGVSYNRP